MSIYKTVTFPDWVYKRIVPEAPEGFLLDPLIMAALAEGLALFADISPKNVPYIFGQMIVEAGSQRRYYTDKLDASGSKIGWRNDLFTNPRSIGRSGEHGLFQIMPDVVTSFNKKFSQKFSFDHEAFSPWGCGCMAMYWLNRFWDDPSIIKEGSSFLQALAMYNAGQNGYLKKGVNYSRGQRYANSIAFYSQFYRPSGLEIMCNGKWAY